MLGVSGASAGARPSHDRGPAAIIRPAARSAANRPTLPHRTRPTKPGRPSPPRRRERAQETRVAPRAAADSEAPAEAAESEGAEGAGESEQVAKDVETPAEGS